MNKRMSAATKQRNSSSPGSVPILRAAQLRKSFKMGDSNVEVLKNVNLDLQPGEFVAIEGRSGSGKSTLLHIIGALDAADSGTIEYGGQDIAAMDGNARSRRSAAGA